MTVDFEDYFPSMMERYGARGLLTELCNGFRLLMDGERVRITFESLKMKSVGLGLSDLKDEEIVCMLDLDGDGALDQLEFCILMFRLSPSLFILCSMRHATIMVLSKMSW
ncbi:hypothetical protein V6N11_000747 [Hibiscus sabdariffa]|uniref:EF-hand domain-containing protein n=1 Tax=Hibiscus sabdariffa TaxID=183260 RepID=A0ABR2RXQ7_9ROSI